MVATRMSSSPGPSEYVLVPLRAAADFTLSARERNLSICWMKIQRVLAQQIRELYTGWRSSSSLLRPICIVLLSLLVEGCTRPSLHEPITLTLLDEWSNKTFGDARQQELRQFTRETGIRVNLLPSPESAWKKLVLWRELVGTGTSGPDVYSLDVIWPGMLSEYFVDLKPYFANEVSLQFPAIRPKA